MGKYLPGKCMPCKFALLSRIDKKHLRLAPCCLERFITSWILNTGHIISLIVKEVLWPSIETVLSSLQAAAVAEMLQTLSCLYQVLIKCKFVELMIVISDLHTAEVGCEQVSLFRMHMLLNLPPH